MTETVKPGLYAVEVKATFTDVHGMLWAVLAGDGKVAASELRALPRGMTAEERAVVDASLAGHATAIAEHGNDYADDYWRPHMRACTALLASRTPPDPVAELVAAAKEAVYAITHLSPCRDDGAHDCRISKADLARLRAALAAVEAARGGK